MWHWNSLWAPAPGAQPAVDDPALWRTAWTPEQALVVQARSWDTMVTASRAWWSFWMAAMPLPGAVTAGQVPAPVRTESDAPPRPARPTGRAAATTAAKSKRSTASRRPKRTVGRTEAARR